MEELTKQEQSKRTLDSQQREAVRQAIYGEVWQRIATDADEAVRAFLYAVATATVQQEFNEALEKLSEHWHGWQEWKDTARQIANE